MPYQVNGDNLFWPSLWKLLVFVQFYLTFLFRLQPKSPNGWWTGTRTFRKNYGAFFYNYIWTWELFFYKLRTILVEFELSDEILILWLKISASNKISRYFLQDTSNTSMPQRIHCMKVRFRPNSLGSSQKIKEINICTVLDVWDSLC